MKNVRLGLSRYGLFEQALGVDQVDAAEDVLRPFGLGRRLVQRKHGCRFEWTSQIDHVRTVLRRLETVKHTRERDIRAVVENESEYALGVVANQQDHGFGEVRIAEIPACHQHLSGAQTPGILGLDGKKTGWRRLAFDEEVGGER